MATENVGSGARSKRPVFRGHFFWDAAKGVEDGMWKFTEVDLSDVEKGLACGLIREVSEFASN